MPDLVQALTGMFDGGDMTIFQATVDAVGQGVVTVHFNGGTFTDVPYLDMQVAGAIWPSIGDTCYVIGRKDWGLLVIGRPAPGPDRTTADGVVAEWNPYTMTRVRKDTGVQTVSTTGDVSITTGAQGYLAAFHFDLADLPALPGTALATASFFLDMPSFENPGVDYNYLEIGLHNVGPGVPFAAMPNLNATYRAYAGISQYVSIPLDWAGRLITGEAKGIYVLTDDYPAVISGPGTVRITSL